MFQRLRTHWGTARRPKCFFSLSSLWDCWSYYIHGTFWERTFSG